jgi:hypothetical protein
LHAERLVGAFSLRFATESAVVVTLDPGVYTVVASSSDGISTGVVLLEVYEVF